MRIDGLCRYRDLYFIYLCIVCSYYEDRLTTKDGLIKQSSLPFVFLNMQLQLFQIVVLKYFSGLLSVCTFV